MSGQHCTSRCRHICAFTLDIAVTDSPPPAQRTPMYSLTPARKKERNKERTQTTNRQKERERERERESNTVRRTNKQTSRQTNNKVGIRISKYDSMRAHQNMMTAHRNMRRLVRVFAANLMLE